jgi:drug/metabolite transporter (DMT)-like permease
MMTRADLLVLLAALIWGLAYLAQKTAMTDVGPVAFVASRATVAMLVLLPFALREGGPRPWGFMALGGVAFLAAAGIQQVGIVTASVSNTAFLTALYVIVAPILALVLWRRNAGWQVWTGAVLALAGAFALAGGELASFGTGDWLVAASAVGWAAYMLVTERAGAAGRPLSYTAGVFATVALLAWPVAFGRGEVSAPALLAAAPEILFVGVFSSALTFGLMAIAMRSIPAPRAAILLASEAVFAAVAAAVLLDERLGLWGWAGAALILAAVILVQMPSRGRANG